MKCTVDDEEKTVLAAIQCGRAYFTKEDNEDITVDDFFYTASVITQSTLDSFIKPNMSALVSKNE